MSNEKNEKQTIEPRKVASEASTTELDESELDQVAGGLGALAQKAHSSSALGKWKVSSFDGKGNDVVTEEITLAVEPLSKKTR